MEAYSVTAASCLGAQISGVDRGTILAAAAVAADLAPVTVLL